MSPTPPSSSTTSTADVPTQVFQAFLANLAAAGAQAELVARLKKTLLEQRTITDSALKAAVFGDEE